MKLIKAYVRGFGNIVNTKIDFTKNIYEICEDNGYGKSTIAHFIKAMFYGFETTRKNDSNITDRKKFLPFNSSAYGGSLDFEYQGHLYHVDRVFGAKSQKEDLFEYSIDGKPNNVIGYYLGQALFNLDEEAFTKTIFFESGDFDVKPNDNINGLLAHILGNYSDEPIVQSGIKQLEEDKKNINSRKATSQMQILKEEQGEVINKIKNFKDKIATLPSLYEAQAQADTRLKNIDEILKKNENYLQYKAFKDQLEIFDKNLKDVDKNQKNITRKYPDGLPTMDEFEHYEALKTKDNALTAPNLKLTDENTKELDALKLEFEGKDLNTFNLYAFLGLEDKIQKATFELQNIQNLLSEGDKTLEGKSEEYFDKEIKHLELLEEKVATFINPKDEKPLEVAKPKVFSKKNLPFLLSLFTLPVFLILAITLIFINQIVGIVFIGLACISLISSSIFGYLMYQRKPVSKTETVEDNAQMSALLSEINQAGYRESKITAKTLVWLNEKVKSLKTYLKLLSRLQEENERLNNLRNEYNNLVHTYYNGKYLDYSFGQTLKQKIDRFSDLTSSFKSDETALKNYQEIKDQLTKDLSIFEDKYIPSFADKTNYLLTLKSDLKELASLNIKKESFEQQKADIETKLKSYENNEEIANIEDYKQEQQDLIKEQAERNALIKSLEDDKETLLDLEVRKRELKKKEGELNKEASLYDAAISMMSVADETFKNKIIGPLMNNFVTFSKELKDTLGQEVKINSQYQIIIEGAREHTLDYLSTGEKTIIVMLFRLALIKAIFPSENPFLVLDDPFMSLDATNFDKMKDFIKLISEHFQVLYLTCHKARLLEGGKL